MRSTLIQWCRKVLWVSLVCFAIESLVYYAYYAVYDFKVDGLLYYKISDTEVEVRGESAVDGTEIVIPSKVRRGGKLYAVTSIGSQAFDCSKRRGDDALGPSAVVIPPSVTHIGDRAFSSCSLLYSITIPSGVTRIGKQAFYGCSSLVSVCISGHKTNIGREAFRACSNLLFVTMQEGSVACIEERAFSDCFRLVSLRIPDGVTTIGNQAFYACFNLSEVILPASLADIGKRAFSNCVNLLSVTSLSRNPSSVSDDVFDADLDGIYSAATLYCPTPHVYAATDGWRRFKHILKVSDIHDARQSANGQRRRQSIVYDMRGNRVTEVSKGQYYLVNCFRVRKNRRMRGIRIGKYYFVKGRKVLVK